MSLANAFGIDTNAGSDDLKKALDAIQAVQGPNAAQLTLPQLQQYVQQGLLTPAQYNAVIADPETYSKVISATQDNSGSNAQKAALQQLGGIVNAGGSTDINKANLLNNINSTNQAMKASRDGIMENAQERGVSGGGLDFMKQLADEQGNSANANSNAVNSAASNAQLALNAMSQQGSIGGTMQGQANQMSQAQADAARQIAEYNSQLQSSANQYNTTNANNAQAANLAEKQRMADQNTTNANDRTKYNATVPQTIYQDQMQKANAMAGAYANQAQLDQSHAQQNAAFTGNLIGAGATVAGAYYGGKAPGGSSSGATPGMDTSSSDYMTNVAANKPQFAEGGEVEGGGLMDKIRAYMMAHNGIGGADNKDAAGAFNVDDSSGTKCYAQGGEVHDHTLCMKAGGPVPGKASVPGNSYQNDTVDAKLSPGEVVLPRSVTQSPDAPQKAAQFMGKQPGSTTPTVNSFAEVLKALEDQGIELKLGARG